MLLVKCKQKLVEDDVSWGDEIRLVVAVIDNRYIVDDSDTRYYPHSFAKDSLDIVYGEIPEEWIEVTGRAGMSVRSFPLWANDEFFYGNLVDNYDQAATRRVFRILQKYTKDQLDRFIRSTFVSTQAATKAVRQMELRGAKSRGFEIAEDVSVRLTFDNVYHAFREVKDIVSK